MHLPRNDFKRAIAEGRHQLGLWCTSPDPSVTELLAGCGYDWLLLDTEHSPSDPITVLGLLQAVAAYPGSAIVRPASNDTVLIKRFLDVGAQTLLIPYVESAEEAQRAVAAMRYAPGGVRGVAGVMRASRFGRVPDYIRHAEQELCLIVQVETAKAMDALDEIASVDGVDGVFIGPADLAASMGHPGQPGHPEVRRAIDDAIRRLKAMGRPAGILSTDETYARHYMELGTVFTAVGVDLHLLAKASDDLLARFRTG